MSILSDFLKTSVEQFAVIAMHAKNSFFHLRYDNNVENIPKDTFWTSLLGHTILHFRPRFEG